MNGFSEKMFFVALLRGAFGWEQIVIWPRGLKSLN